MQIDSPTAADSPDASTTGVPPPSPLAWARLILALLITTVALPYAWGRVIVGTMIDWPELHYRVGVLAGCLAVLGLTWKLGRQFQSSHISGWLRWLDPALLLIWFVQCAVLVGMMTGPGLPVWIVTALFAPSMLWMPWLLWWPFRSGWERVPLLIVLVLLGALFPALIAVKGVTGEIHMEFAWRNQPAPAPIIRSKTKPSSDNNHARADVSTVGPQDFTQFLGPRRTGVVTGVSLARDWQAQPPEKLWEIPVGLGWSGFAIVGEYCFTQEQEGPNECVVCRRMRDGGEVWRHADPALFKSVLGGDGPRATPTVADGLVYTVGAKGRLNCLQGADGAVVWSADIIQENHGGDNLHGVCGSPLVYKDLVIVCPTRTLSAILAAYDRHTGRPAWQAVGKGDASYSSPMIANVAGETVLLYHNAVELGAYDPDTGRTLWTFRWTNDQQVNSSQCVVIPGAGDEPDRILASTGYSVGAVLLEASYTSTPDSADEAEWRVKEIWKSRGMKTKFTTAVRLVSAIYGLDDGILAAIDVGTGKQLWKGGRYGHGQILLAEDLLLVQAERGEVLLVDPQPGKFIELGRLPALMGKTWNNPALSKDRLLIRNDHAATCYRLPLRE